MMGLRSKDAYYKYIERGSSLTLEEAITIAQSNDATANQVGYMRPEFKSNPAQMEVHKLHAKDGTRTPGAKKGKVQLQKNFTDDKQKKSRRESCFNCGAKPSHPRSECPARKVKCFKRGKEGHFSSVCKSKTRDARVNEVHAQAATAFPLVDCVPVYLNALIHHLMTVAVKSLNHPALRVSHSPAVDQPGIYFTSLPNLL